MFEHSERRTDRHRRRTPDHGYAISSPISSGELKMKKIRLKMKALECLQELHNDNPMGAIFYHENQNSDPI